MNRLFKFDGCYFFFFILLLITEVLIAMYVHDHFVRPYLGDVLVVILIYCFIRSFLQTSYKWTILAVLLFAFLIEGLQYINFVDRLGISGNTIAAVALGNSFAWEDMLAYIAGAVVIWIVEKLRLK